MSDELMNINEIDELYNNIAQLIDGGKTAVAKAVNESMISMYWNIGKTLCDDILLGERAQYGETRKLISTKSLDVATSSYQDPKKLQRMLDKYSESMKTFETKYFKGTDTITWANEKLSISDYDQKVLELVFPDVIMTEDSINILNTFKKTMEAEGFEIWYRIAY